MEVFGDYCLKVLTRVLDFSVVYGNREKFNVIPENTRNSNHDTYEAKHLKSTKHKCTQLSFVRFYYNNRKENP